MKCNHDGECSFAPRERFNMQCVSCGRRITMDDDCCHNARGFPQCCDAHCTRKATDKRSKVRGSVEYELGALEYHRRSAKAQRLYGLRK